MPIPLFIDFEASSLDGFPIEIGWCDHLGNTEAHLIRPVAHWTDWNPASERLHGLSRDTLMREGESVRTVAARAQAVFENRLLFSDNWAWDQEWLCQLYEAAGLACATKVHPVSEVFVHACGGVSDAVGRRLIEEATRQHSAKIEHRAAADARRHWSIWQTIIAAAKTG